MTPVSILRRSQPTILLRHHYRYQERASASCRQMGSTVIRCATTTSNRFNHNKMAPATSGSPLVTLDNMNPHVREMQYAVRGPIVIRAGEIENELAKGVSKPFSRVIRANIGDCHAVGQKPITFLRQVLALIVDKSLLSSNHFPDDAKRSARRILASCYGESAGSYSDSVGIRVIREDVARFIEERDGGIASDPDNILLTTGASEAVKIILQLINHNDGMPTGVMVPVPQYPLYSATTTELGQHRIDYYLDEDNAWALPIDELDRALKASAKECRPRALCVINPGNPTGQVLSRQNIEDIVKFAYDNRLLILADEVYQHNVYAHGCKFHSFKSVMNEMGAPYAQLELVSFHSISKGFMGECGLRGGYMEVINFDADVMAMLKKSVSARLCSTTIGQAGMGVVVNPPREGDPSHEAFEAEKKSVLDSLAVRAKLVTHTLNDIPGISCNEVQGAMYAFPQLHLPEPVVRAAKAKGMEADAYYSLHLLENTGVCIVPGSGFGQRPGTYHFRTTILPPEDMISEMLGAIREFHAKFIASHN